MRLPACLALSATLLALPGLVHATSPQPTPSTNNMNTEITGGLGISSTIQEHTITERIVIKPAQTAAPAEPLPANTKRIILMYGDVKRSFLVHAPPVLQQPFCPLLFSFHPEGLSAKVQETLTGFSDIADEKGFVVVYPEALGTPARWNTGPNEAGQFDQKFIQDIIDNVLTLYAINMTSIFVSGMSNGAQMAARLACTMPDRIAAAGLVAGNYPQWNDCLPRPVSAIIFHGTADQTTPYGGKALQRGPEGLAQFIALQNKCPNGPGEAYNKDDARAVGWGNCAAGTEVVNFTFEGKGHSWPGSAMPEEITSKTIDASSVMWNFFSTHRQLPYSIPPNPVILPDDE